MPADKDSRENPTGQEEARPDEMQDAAQALFSGIAVAEAGSNERLWEAMNPNQLAWFDLPLRDPLRRRVGFV